MKQHLTIRVYGRVQGVYYRQSTRQKAVELGLTGLVRNEPDGSVYIEAEGDPQILAQFQQWCESGPPHAQVTGLDVEEGELQSYEGFEVHR